MQCKMFSTCTDTWEEFLADSLGRCAMGACLADREDADPELLDPEFYSSRAKALLDIEMDSPTVATVQALVIMSATEAAFTRDSRGWLYSGELTLRADGSLLVVDKC